MQIALPVAQGVRTDHPDPSLPLVDDSHIPIHDGKAIEQLGRREEHWTWGRYDAAGDRWSAFTTDQRNPTYAWIVTSVPGFGQTVLLYTDDAAHTAYEHEPREGRPLLYRAGGYWWDGQQWNRPERVFDKLTERFVQNKVPDAASVDAASYLGKQKVSRKALHVGVTDIEMFEHDEVGLLWQPHEQAANIAAWSSARPAGALPLEQCIVGVDAPELDRDATLNERAAAKELGMKLGAVRDLITDEDRGHVNRVFPAPQIPGLRSGGQRWSVPVLRQWAWQERREHPGQCLPEEYLMGDIPLSYEALEGVLHCIANSAVADMHATRENGIDDGVIILPTEKALRWITSSDPQYLEALFADVLRTSEQEAWRLDRENVVHALRQAMHMSVGKDVGDDAVNELLELTLPPSVTGYMPE